MAWFSRGGFKGPGVVQGPWLPDSRAAPEVVDIVFTYLVQIKQPESTSILIGPRATLLQSVQEKVPALDASPEPVLIK